MNALKSGSYKAKPVKDFEKTADVSIHWLVLYMDTSLISTSGFEIRWTGSQLVEEMAIKAIRRYLINFIGQLWCVLVEEYLDSNKNTFFLLEYQWECLFISIL